MNVLNELYCNENSKRRVSKKEVINLSENSLKNFLLYLKGFSNINGNFQVLQEKVLEFEKILQKKNICLCDRLINNEIPETNYKKIAEGMVHDIYVIRSLDLTSILSTNKSKGYFINAEKKLFSSLNTKINPAIKKNIQIENGEKFIYALNITDKINDVFIFGILKILLPNAKNILEFYDFFICRNRINLFYDFSNHGSLDNFLAKNLVSIPVLDNMVKKFVAQLQFLKDNFGFCHNDLKIDNILVREEAGEFSLLLADLDKSTIYFNKVFFGPKNSLDVLELKYKPKIKDSKEYYVVDDYNKLIPNFLLGQSTKKFYYGYFITFDFYILFVSLMIKSVIVKQILIRKLEETFIYQFWKNLWFEDEFEIINERVLTAKFTSRARYYQHVVLFKDLKLWAGAGPYPRKSSRSAR
jgi:serine/threonine protein kinase